MAEPLLPVNPDAFRVKSVTVKRDRPPPDIHIVRGEEARRIVEQTLPALYTPHDLYPLVGPPSSVYYRVYKSRDGYGVFYLFEWPDQKIPPHKYDYEPVIVLTDKNGVPREVYVDGYHYFVRRTTLPRGRRYWWIEIDAPWRSMKVKTGSSPDDMVMVYPVDESTGYAIEPVYLSDRILSELRKRSENPLKINERLIRNPWSVRHAEHWMTYRSPTTEELLFDILENYGLAKYAKTPLTLKFVSALLRLRRTLENIFDRIKSLITSPAMSERREKQPVSN